MTKPRRTHVPRRKRVLVAMSGGVDSSVAACLLHEQGHEIMGMFMRVGAETPQAEKESCPSASTGEGSGRTAQGCCSAADAADARFVAGMLGIPFYSLNFKADFERIIEYFADEYAAGRTPNPCVPCNTRLKFGKLLEYADAVGAEYVATGHYARLQRRDGRIVLRRGCDERKDQSYFLFDVRRELFERALFPVGHLTKEQVRAEAKRFGLPVSDKPDSVEICFVPDGNYASVVRRRRPEAFRTGEVIDSAGRVLGTHDGVANFTIGQRRGLGIAAGIPLYVTRLDAASNTVTLGEREQLRHQALVATGPSFLDAPPTAPITCTAKIRYQHQAANCTARLLDDDRMRVDFKEPQSAITPGQAVVLYDGEEVLGGGWIERAL